MHDELISKARGGDRDAFGQLLAENYDFIHAVAWRWTGNVADAEDVTQDVCVKLGRMIGDFRGESRFRTWLYTLTLNAVRDQVRKSVRERAKTMAYFSDPSNQIDCGGDDETQPLWEAVRSLPAKQCDAVMLIYSEGLSHSAAADVMGCSESTVSWHVHEARKRLRDMLGREVA